MMWTCTTGRRSMSQMRYRPLPIQLCIFSSYRGWSALWTGCRVYGVASSEGPHWTLQAQKKRVEAILGEDATIDGLENVEVKVFK